ncbi:MAG: 5'-methylthioadenosine/S-adenosylhomocysteine nucleosidase [Clostridia bacterium]|nr:5'-methylthioadenosine/S-adenosylhomocysteine nucleosidase [Clostridia bacterium]
MIKLGAVIAVKSELEGIFGNIIAQANVITVGSFTVYEILRKNLAVYVVNSGYGEIAAARAAQFMVDRMDVDLLYNTGLCGKLHKGYAMYQPVAVKSVVHYDIDTSAIDNCEDCRYLKYPDCFIPVPEKAVDFAAKALNLDKAVCMSGDKFITDLSTKEYFTKRFGGDICEMEAAGLLLTANANSIPLIMIKCVSDGEADGEAAKEYFGAKKGVHSILEGLTLKLFDALEQNEAEFLK